jgi:hypothetical protein
MVQVPVRAREVFSCAPTATPGRADDFVGTAGRMGWRLTYQQRLMVAIVSSYVVRKTRQDSVELVVR